MTRETKSYELKIYDQSLMRFEAAYDAFGSVTCSHPPCNFAARGGGFSLKATDVASIDELSPCAPRFRFL